MAVPVNLPGSPVGAASQMALLAARHPAFARPLAHFDWPPQELAEVSRGSSCRQPNEMAEVGCALLDGSSLFPLEGIWTDYRPFFK